MITMRTANDDDIRILQEVVRRVLNENINPARSVPDVQDFLAPEVYVIKPQGGGIPGITRGQIARPGVAKCDVYKIKGDGGVVPIGLEKWVYNLATTPVSVGWSLAVRDKSGYWICTAHAPVRIVAMLCHKISFPIVPMLSDDVFPSTLLFPHYYGEYSWHEMMEGLDAKWVRKPGGFEGHAGGHNALVGINRTNMNVHLQHHRVEIWPGLSEECQSSEDDPWCQSSYNVQSSIGCFSSEEQSSDEPKFEPAHLKWYFQDPPREDGPDAKRYIISHLGQNETVQP